MTILTTDNRPLATDWTIGQVLAWIAEDDTRCHDESLRSLLQTVDAALDPAKVAKVEGPATVALVRSIASHTRTRPALRDLRLDELDAHALASPPARAPLMPSSADAPAAAA